MVFPDSYIKSETDNLLADKVSATGAVSINNTLNTLSVSITNTTSRPLGINNTMHNYPYLAATSQTYSNQTVVFASRCLPLSKL